MVPWLSNFRHNMHFFARGFRLRTSFLSSGLGLRVQELCLRGVKDQLAPRFGVAWGGGGGFEWLLLNRRALSLKAMLVPHLCALVFRAEKEGHVDRNGDGDGDDDDDFQDGGHLGGASHG